MALLVRGKGYDFAKAQQYLTFLDTELEKANPGASEILLKYGLQPIDAAWRLSQVVPNIISVPFEAGASKHMLHAMIADLMEQMRNAAPVSVELSK